MDDLLKDYEQDVADALQAVLQSEDELKNAVDWHLERLEKYREELKRLQDYKKDL